MFQSPSKRQKATKVPPQDTIAASIPTKSTHDSSEQHYDTLDKFCSEYILIGPGGYDTKEEEERVLTSIKMYRGVFDFSEKIVDRLVCRLRIFDLMCKVTLAELHSYTDDEWTKLMKTLSSLRNTLRSPSAQKTHIPVFCGFDTLRHHYVHDADIPFDVAEKESPSPGAVKECFESPYLRLYEECNVQRVLSTIRKKLDMADQVADGSILPLVLSAQHLQTFIDAVDKHFATNKRLHAFFISLLKFDGETVVGLLPAAELKAKVEKYQLKTFHFSLILLLQHWSTTLENSSSTVKYPSGSPENKKGVTKVDNGDVIVQAYAVPSEQADTMDDAVKDLPTLSTPPTPARKPEIVKSNPVSPTKATPAQSDGTDKKKKRMRFTDDEKNSIKMGLEIHGKGNWAAIKREFPDVLINRTSVQIKDCYRTMVKLGEIIEPPKNTDENINEEAPVLTNMDETVEMNAAVQEGEIDNDHDASLTHV